MMSYTSVLLLLATFVALSSSIPTLSRVPKPNKPERGGFPKNNDFSKKMGSMKGNKPMDFDFFGMMCQFMGDQCQEYNWEVEQDGEDSIPQTGYVVTKFDHKMTHLHSERKEGEDTHTFINMDTMAVVLKPNKFGPCYLTKFDQDSSSVEDYMKQWNDTSMQITNQITLDGTGDVLSSRAEMMEELKDDETFMKLCLMGGLVKAVPMTGDQDAVEDGKDMLDLLSFNTHVNLLVRNEALETKNPFANLMNRWGPNKGKNSSNDGDREDKRDEMISKLVDKFPSGDGVNIEEKKEMMSEMFDKIKESMKGGKPEDFDFLGMMCEFMGDQCQEYNWEVEQDGDEEAIHQMGHIVDDKEFDHKMALVVTERKEGPEEHTFINLDSMMAVVKPTKFGPCFLTKFDDGMSVESDMIKWNNKSITLANNIILDGTADKLSMAEMMEELKDERMFGELCFMSGVIKAIPMAEEQSDVNEGHKMLSLLSFNAKIKLLVRKDALKNKNPFSEMMKKFHNQNSGSSKSNPEKSMPKKPSNPKDDKNKTSGDKKQWLSNLSNKFKSKQSSGTESKSSGSTNKDKGRPDVNGVLNTIKNIKNRLSGKDKKQNKEEANKGNPFPKFDLSNLFKKKSSDDKTVKKFNTGADAGKKKSMPKIDATNVNKFITDLRTSVGKTMKEKKDKRPIFNISKFKNFGKKKQ